MVRAGGVLVGPIAIGVRPVQPRLVVGRNGVVRPSHEPVARHAEDSGIERAAVGDGRPSAVGHSANRVPNGGKGRRLVRAKMDFDHVRRLVLASTPHLSQRPRGRVPAIVFNDNEPPAIPLLVSGGRLPGEAIPIAVVCPACRAGRSPAPTLKSIEGNRSAFLQRVALAAAEAIEKVVGRLGERVPCVLSATKRLPQTTGSLYNGPDRSGEVVRTKSTPSSPLNRLAAA